MPVLDPPVPIDAVINLAFNFCNVTFSHPCQPTVKDTANWKVRWLAQDRPVLAASINIATPNLVNLALGIAAPDPGPTGVSYSPPPFDIISNTAKPTPAPAFADFPLHL